MSISQENYLKALFNLQTKNSGTVKTQSLSDSLSIAPGSVTEMLKKLADEGYVSYVPYKGVVLTDSGSNLGRNMLRRHRLIELFLCKTLGFSWDEVHEEAENLEHAVSDVLIDRIDTVLGSPKFDPHGDPIPDKNGNFEQINKILLCDQTPNSRSMLMGIKDTDDAFLKYLSQKNIKLGSVITVLDKEPFDESMTVDIDQNTHFISKIISTNIYVQPL